MQLCFSHCKRCKKCVFLHACHINCHVGLGWGVGCNDIVEHARMFDATSPVGLGWGGGWGGMTSLNMHACLMLRHPWGWGGVGGWGVMTSLNLHTWLMPRHPWGWGGGWDVNVPCTCTHVQCYATPDFLLGCQRSLHLHTCSMLRNSCVSCRDVNVPCTCTCRSTCW